MLKENSLKDKTILVTGGGTGLGKSMSSYFLELGANVVIASRKKEVLDKTAKELMKRGKGAQHQEYQLNEALAAQDGPIITRSLQACPKPSCKKKRTGFPMISIF